MRSASRSRSLANASAAAMRVPRARLALRPASLPSSCCTLAGPRLRRRRAGALGRAVRLGERVSVRSGRFPTVRRAGRPLGPPVASPASLGAPAPPLTGVLVASIDGVGTEALAPLGCVVAITPRVVADGLRARAAGRRATCPSETAPTAAAPDWPRPPERSPPPAAPRPPDVAFLGPPRPAEPPLPDVRLRAAATRSTSTGTAAARSARARAGQPAPLRPDDPRPWPSRRNRDRTRAAAGAAGALRRRAALAVVAAASSLVCHGCPIVEVAERENAPAAAMHHRYIAVGGGDREIPAATYSPRGFPPKYHRRWRSSLPCSEWERVFPRRNCHRKPVWNCRSPHKDSRASTSSTKNLVRK